MVSTNCPMVLTNRPIACRVHRSPSSAPEGSSPSASFSSRHRPPSRYPLRPSVWPPLGELLTNTVHLGVYGLQFLDGLFHRVDLIVGDATFTHVLDMTAQTLYEAATLLNLNLYCL